MMKIKAPIVLLFAFLSACAPIFAHHGNAEFDMKQSVTLKATIAEFVWSNPHSIIYFDVRNDQGKVTRWSCELANVSHLHRVGWTRQSLKPGDQVTIVAHPAKSGMPVAYFQKVILANGEELGMGTPE
jgi:hypothetical protein